MSKHFTRHSFVTIYKVFVRPHLGYGDTIYDEASTESFSQKIEIIQYNAALAVTVSIKGLCQSKLCSELSFQTLKFKPNLFNPFATCTPLGK